MTGAFDNFPAVVALTAQLVSCGSQPEGYRRAQELLAARLAVLGFSVQEIRAGVSNLWCYKAHRDPAARCLAFCGHTDVVSAGDPAAWDSPPYEPALRDGALYGRGSADMQGGNAAFVVALEELLAGGGELPCSVAVLIAGDEETAAEGTSAVLSQVLGGGMKIDYCLSGEPSGLAKFGDRMMIGRRGTLTGRVFVHGAQGHVAYPEKAKNPILPGLEAVARIGSLKWHAGDENWPCSSLQFTNIKAGTGETNVIPAVFEAVFNIRYSVHHSRDEIIAKVDSALCGLPAEYSTKWSKGGKPFLTADAFFAGAARRAAEEASGRICTTSCAGGTSDARFFAEHGIPAVELGPSGEHIHKVNERVSVQDLCNAVDAYKRIITALQS
jgi:succinyl-diaminopimelate desuccinylase